MKKIKRLFKGVYYIIILFGLLFSFRLVAVGVMALELPDFPGKGLVSALIALLITVLSRIAALDFIHFLGVLVKILVGCACGFRFYVVRLGRWEIARREGKIKSTWLKEKSKGFWYRMCAPEKWNKNYPLLLYHCSEVFYSGAFALGCFLSFYYFQTRNSLLAAVLFVFGFEAGIFEFIGFFWDNLEDLQIPFCGYYIPWVKRAVWQVDQIWNSMAHGKRRFREMPEEWFEWTGEYDIVNGKTDELAYFCMRYLTYKERYVEALRLGRDVVESKSEWPLTRRQAAVTVLYCLMVLEEGREVSAVVRGDYG